MNAYWKVQKAGDPLFPDLIWSRPENKNQAGKLLIAGGNVHSIGSAASAYESANKAGAGAIKVILPDSIRSSLKSLIPEAEFCPSTPSGSFARSSLAEFIDYASWSDMTLLPGDLGRNSETAILLESFINKYKGSVCLTKDALDYFTNNPAPIVGRPNTLIVGSVAQLQKISIKIDPNYIIKFDMDLLRLVETLHNLTLASPIALVIKHDDNIVASFNGQVSSTKLLRELPKWRVAVAAYCSVWMMQNPDKTFEAISSGIANFLD